MAEKPICIVVPKQQTTYQIKCSSCGTFGRYTDQEFAREIAKRHADLYHEKAFANEP